ncbi:hypothetical protein R1flu_012157 [Riccia fluitans]|uniref:Uncharacterized protein n=1 Tax=Riccia fluitans TaxID=41844 RepID=A0ABD1ZAS2_9MARC
MHRNCQNLLKCLDILSVALVVGLALEDAPPRDSCNSQEEEALESNESEETREELVDREENSDEEEAKKHEDAKEKAKMDEGVGSSSNSSNSLNPRPVTGSEKTKEVDHSSSVIEEEQSLVKSAHEKERHEESKKGTEEMAKDESYSSTTPSPGKGNLKRKLGKEKTIEYGEECKQDKIDQYNETITKRARNYTTDSSDSSRTEKFKTVGSSRSYPSRAYHYSATQGSNEILGRSPKSEDSGTDDDESLNLKTDMVSESDSEADRGVTPIRDTLNRSKKRKGTAVDQGVSEAEFVQHVQDSLEQVPTFADNEPRNLHSNSGRKLEAAAAIRDRIKKGRDKDQVKDQGVTEAEFVQLVQDSLEKAPGFTTYVKEGLHSNSGRELESAGAIKHATTTLSESSAVPEHPKVEKQGLHSNTVRELVGAAVLAKKGLHSNTTKKLKSTPVRKHATTSSTNSEVPEHPKYEKQGLHSNTVRELVGAAVLADSQSRLDSDGTRGQWPEESRPGSNTNRNQQSNAQRELHSERKKSYESEGTSKKSPRRISQRSLIGNSVAAALHISTQSPSEENPNLKPKRELSARTLVGVSYERQVSSDSEETSSSDDSRSQNNQKRKLSQNELRSLGHLELRDTWDTNAAGHSNAPQIAVYPQRNEAPGEGPPYASYGQSVSFSDEVHSSSKRNLEPQMSTESSIDVKRTFREDINFESLTSTYSSHSGSHHQPPSTDREFNTVHRYHLNEQPPHTATQCLDTSTREVTTRYLGSSETPSESCSCIWSDILASDPHIDRNENIGHPEETTNYFPSPPLTTDEQQRNNPQQPILSHPPPLPPDENFSNNTQPISNRFLHYNPADTLNLEPRFFLNTSEPLSSLPWPWNPPNGDYSAPFPVDINQLYSNREPRPERHPYPRVGHSMPHRRPRCGLLIVKAMRNDQSLPVDRRKGNRIPRTPGNIDINFRPRVGDIILRHVRLPGQGAVEIWYPDLQPQDGDSLVRIKLDPFSYDSGTRESSNLLIVKAKGYIRFEDMWIYMGRATHSIIKTHQRVLGVGATNGRTIYVS